MTSQTNSRYAFKFVFATAATAAFVVAGSVGAGNSEHSAMHGAGIDVSALHTSAAIAYLPVVYVAEPF
jgi:hypothetical protein